MANNAPNKRKKRSLGLKFYMVFWIIIAAAFAGATSREYAKYKKNMASQAAVAAELAVETELTADLNRQLLHNGSDQYIEEVAREKLGLVRDEILFYNSSLQKP
jgi:cell division protein FtsB